jgi:hypothetical protein
MSAVIFPDYLLLRLLLVEHLFAPEEGGTASAGYQLLLPFLHKQWSILYIEQEH